jgi:hypothetical protein
MQITLDLHQIDGTYILTLTPETREDADINTALFGELDPKGLIGSGSGDGSSPCQIILYPKTHRNQE